MDSALDNVTRSLFAQLRSRVFEDDSQDFDCLICPKCSDRLEPLLLDVEFDALDHQEYQTIWWTCRGLNTKTCIFPLNMPKEVFWARRSMDQMREGLLPLPNIHLLPAHLHYLYPSYFKDSSRNIEELSAASSFTRKKNSARNELLGKIANSSGEYSAPGKDLSTRFYRYPHSLCGFERLENERIQYHGAESRRNVELFTDTSAALSSSISLQYCTDTFLSSINSEMSRKQLVKPPLAICERQRRRLTYHMQRCRRADAAGGRPAQPPSAVIDKLREKVAAGELTAPTSPASSMKSVEMLATNTAQETSCGEKKRENDERPSENSAAYFQFSDAEEDNGERVNALNEREKLPPIVSDASTKTAEQLPGDCSPVLAQSSISAPTLSAVARKRPRQTGNTHDGRRTLTDLSWALIEEASTTKTLSDSGLQTLGDLARARNFEPTSFKDRGHNSPLPISTVAAPAPDVASAPPPAPVVAPSPQPPENLPKNLKAFYFHENNHPGKYVFKNTRRPRRKAICDNEVDLAMAHFEEVQKTKNLMLRMGLEIEASGSEFENESEDLPKRKPFEDVTENSTLRFGSGMPLEAQEPCVSACSMSVDASTSKGTPSDGGTSADKTLTELKLMKTPQSLSHRETSDYTPLANGGSRPMTISSGGKSGSKKKKRKAVELEPACVFDDPEIQSVMKRNFQNLIKSMSGGGKSRSANTKKRKRDGNQLGIPDISHTQTTPLKHQRQSDLPARTPLNGASLLGGGDGFRVVDEHGYPVELDNLSQSHLHSSLLGNMLNNNGAEEDAMMLMSSSVLSFSGGDIGASSQHSYTHDHHHSADQLFGGTSASLMDDSLGFDFHGRSRNESSSFRDLSAPYTAVDGVEDMAYGLEHF